MKKRYKIVRINAEIGGHRRHRHQTRADCEDLGGCRWHGRRRRKDERGFALLLVFLMAGDRGHHAVHGNSARGDAVAARQGTGADRSRRTVQARDTAFCCQGQALSGRYQGTGELSESALPAPALQRPDDREGRVAPDSRSERHSDGFQGDQTERPGRQGRAQGPERICRRAGRHGRIAESNPGRRRGQRARPAASQRRQQRVYAGTGCTRRRSVNGQNPPALRFPGQTPDNGQSQTGQIGQPTPAYPGMPIPAPQGFPGQATVPPGMGSPAWSLPGMVISGQTRYIPQPRMPAPARDARISFGHRGSGRDHARHQLQLG